MGGAVGKGRGRSGRSWIRDPGRQMAQMMPPGKVQGSSSRPNCCRCLDVNLHTCPAPPHPPSRVGEKVPVQVLLNSGPQPPPHGKGGCQHSLLPSPRICGSRAGDGGDAGWGRGRRENLGRGPGDQEDRGAPPLRLGPSARVSPRCTSPVLSCGRWASLRLRRCFSRGVPCLHCLRSLPAGGGEN